MNDDKKTRSGVGSAGDARGRVLDAINERRFVMRPRWHFVLRGILAAISCFVVLLAGLYLASFVVFLMRHNGAWFVPSFGARGWLVLLLSLPWALVALIGLFILVLELLVRRYSFSYRRPLLVTALALAGLVLLGGVVVGMTPLHGWISSLSTEHDVPFIGRMYREVEAWHRDDVHRGIVLRLNDAGFVFEEYDGDVLRVMVSPKTRIGGAEISEGDTVVVFGPEDDGAIQAVGVRKMTPSDVE